MGFGPVGTIRKQVMKQMKTSNNLSNCLGNSFKSSNTGSFKTPKTTSTFKMPKIKF